MGDWGYRCTCHRGEHILSGVRGDVALEIARSLTRTLSFGAEDQKGEDRTDSGSRTASYHNIGFTLKLKFTTRAVVLLVAQAAATTITLRVAS